jgi:hypothetical protein
MEDLTKKFDDLKVSESAKSSNKESESNIKEDSKNIFKIDLNQDKILIIFAGSDLLWYKTKKSIESDIKPDFIFQKEKFIYYNKKFIKNFFNKILKHPRCHPAFISSMNINNCQILIEQMYKSCEMKKEEQIQNLIYLGKKCHNMTKPKSPDTIPELKRNIGNMCYCINKFFNAKKKFYKLIILESDPEKMSDSTKPYSILCSIFNEDYISKKETRDDVDKKGQKLIEYLENFLNNCNKNIDTYLKENSFEI